MYKYTFDPSFENINAIISSYIPRQYTHLLNFIKFFLFRAGRISENRQPKSNVS